MKNKFLKKFLCLGLTCVMAMSLSACGNKLFTEKTEITSVNGCAFDAPKSIYDTSISYEDIVVSNFVGTYEDNYNGIVFEYDNIFSIDQIDRLFTMAVYDLPDHYDLNDITADNAKETLIKALDSMSFKLSDTGDKWGIDTSAEFYKNLSIASDGDIDVLNENGTQKIIVPYKSIVAMQESSASDATIDPKDPNASEQDTPNMETDSQVEKFDKNKPTYIYNYHGYLTMISDGEETKIMMIHCLEHEKIDIKGYAESLHFAENCGSDIVFNEEELVRINDKAMDAMAQTLVDSGFQTHDSSPVIDDSDSPENQSIPVEADIPEVEE